MEGQIHMFHYRIEAIINRVSKSVDKLEELQSLTEMKLSFKESEILKQTIDDLKEIQ